MTNKKRQFLYPYSPYHGIAQPEYLWFNETLQQFAHRTSYICNLHTGGKISSEQALAQIQILWDAIEASQQALTVQD